MLRIVSQQVNASSLPYLEIEFFNFHFVKFDRNRGCPQIACAMLALNILL